MTDNGDDPIGGGLIHKPELLQLLGIHPSTLHKWCRIGFFPMSMVISPPGSGRELVAWLRGDIEQWLKDRPRRMAKPITQRAYDKVRAKRKPKLRRPE